MNSQMDENAALAAVAKPTKPQHELPKFPGSFGLAAEEPAEAAVSRMAQQLLLAARRYEQGILADCDPEFVHQYRVNLRKCRSLLNLFKTTLQTKRYQTLKTALKALAGRTNTLRDLDVFLLAEESYREMLPADLQPGLNPLFKHVKHQRRAAQLEVGRVLSSKEYLRQLEQLLRTLQESPVYGRKQSRLPVRALVCGKVLDQYQRICDDGREIDSDTPDGAIHELRIECKKLRYLMELFGELFAQKQLKQLIRRLKKLQDNLGRFNDFSVQRAFLETLTQRYKASPEQLPSIQGLQTVLFTSQQQERGLLAKRIAEFTEASVREKFHRLYSGLRG